MSKNKGFSITSADRYSLALYELASDGNVLESIESQSSSILNLISSSKDFSNLIKDPTNNQEDLLKVINNISENNKFETLLKNFLSFLVIKKTIILFRANFKKFY
ncbi:F0F1 ATP synthase subunit delta [Candidatus Pelagibacter bacterium]|nr:F0F1 ATP synthase subunit delta [Candidatus Pelagibacter bacterium]